MEGQVVQHMLVTPQSPDCPRKASCACQTPHTLLLTPQPRRPVWTATSPVTMATASLSGGSVMARRSVLMAPMSLRPLAVSPAPWAEGGGPRSGPQFTYRIFSVGRLGGSSGLICQYSPRLMCYAFRGSWPTGESSS